MVGYGFVGGCCSGVSPKRQLRVTRIPCLRGDLHPIPRFLPVSKEGCPHPPSPQLYCRSLSLQHAWAVLGDHRFHGHPNLPRTSGCGGRGVIALCWASELISGPSAASHGGAEAAAEPISLGEEMGLLSPVQPVRVPAGHRN